MDQRPWVVCKFGGTSVSSRDTWDVIVRRASELAGEGTRVCIVVSAVSQVTNHLERIVDGLGSGDDEGVEQAIAWVLERHKLICQELGVDDAVPQPFLKELQRLVEGIRLTGDAASDRLRARVLGFGELMSSHIGFEVLKRELPDARVGIVDARKVLIASERKESDSLGPQNPADKYLNAEVAPFALDVELAEELTEAADEEGLSRASSAVLDPRSSHFVSKDVVITQGFVASTADGQPCVLGRGGSDTSGALFAALLSAKRLEIWTDVDGMFSSDPRHVPKARLIEELSYREAQELAAMGAKVLHPRCLGPASWGRVPVEIHNTMKRDQQQLTRIMAPEALEDGVGSRVMAIAKRTGQVLLTISTVDMWGESGFLSRVFAPFERLDISVDLIATSQYAVSMTLDYVPGGIHGEPFSILLRALRRQGKLDVETNCTVVSVVGRKLRSVLHGMADAFRELERFNVLLLSESTEDLNMSFVLGSSELEVDDLVRSLHGVLLERDGGLPGSVSPPASPGLAPSSPPSSPPPPLRRRVRAASFAGRAVTSAALARTDPSTWLAEELARYAEVPTPFSIVDVASLQRRAAKMPVFSLAWTTNAAVLQAVARANPEIVFLCRSQVQILALCAAAGPAIKVHMPGAAAGSRGPIPTQVRLQPSGPSEEDLLRATSLMGEARVLVASADEGIEGTAVLDAWFRAPTGLSLVLHSDLAPHVSKVLALGPHSDLLDALFVIEPAAPPTSAALPSSVSRVVLSGVAAAPLDVETQQPAREFVRFAA